MRSPPPPTHAAQKHSDAASKKEKPAKGEGAKEGKGAGSGEGGSRAHTHGQRVSETMDGRESSRLGSGLRSFVRDGMGGGGTNSTRLTKKASNFQ